MRIRTDEKPHRERTIEKVSDHYQCNKTKAMLLAADQVPELHEAVKSVLSDPELSTKDKRRIAERFNEARGIDVEISEHVNVNVE
jgi:F0F1-type ATP synthase delta subunit